MCSLSPSLGPIRSVSTENRHDAAGLLGHMHRLVDSKSIETPALRTSTSRRAFLRASLAHPYVQSESKSVSNPFSMDRDPLLRAGRLDALSARSLQHQERNNLQRFRDQGKIVVEIMISLVHWPAGHRYSQWIWSKGLLLHQLSSCHTFVERKRAKSSTPDLGLQPRSTY